jgi:gliding motility-associated-like protein
MSMKLLKLISLFLLLSSRLQATHLAGGELNYEHLGGNSYRVILTVYRDCGPDNTLGTGFDNTASVGVYSNGNLVSIIEFFLTQAQVTLVPVTSENPCFILPPNLCIQEAIYSKTVTLNPGVTGLDLVYQRCCRNNSILNLAGADATGMTLHVRIPGSNQVSTPNSGAVFNNFPPVALCQGAEFFFDHGATDPDGDQLEYFFCTPKKGGGNNNLAAQGDPTSPIPVPPTPPPFVNVDWNPGYGQFYQLDANPPFSINPTTGYMTGTPTQVGRYAIGVCVSEYRNGVLINTKIRDFQYNVTVCDPNIVASIPDQTNFCDGYTVQFSNNSVNAQFFQWDFGDPNNPGATSDLYSPSYTYSAPGSYTITLVANPGWSCADTASTTYSVFPEINPMPTLSSFDCFNGTPTYSFSVGGQFGDEAEFSWSFPVSWQNVQTSGSNAQSGYTGPPGVFQIQLTVTENGCDETVFLPIEIPPGAVPIIEDQDTFCDGFTYTFGNQSLNSDTWFWHFGVPGATSMLFEPEYTFPDTGNFVVTLTASNALTCPASTSMIFEIYTLLNPSFGPYGVQCFDTHSFNFEALGTVDAAAFFLWEFGDEASIQTSNFPVVNDVTFSSPGFYPVTLTISENGCVRSFTGYVTIELNPVPGFYLLPDQGCPPLEVAFVDTSFSVGPLVYLWEFGDGYFSTDQYPIHTYQSSGSYPITLTIASLTGCVDQRTLENGGEVFVYPVPTAGFSIDPDSVDILQSTVQVTDLSFGGISCFYDFGEGGTSELCNFYYDFKDGGFFTVMQVVTNEYGCYDVAFQPVWVSGFVFYAPNAFTPNGDGNNEFFLPIALGIRTYELSIYNRWGQRIFYSEDRFESWDGTFGGDLVQDGIYLYRAIIGDNMRDKHIFEGHIMLMR